MTLKKQKSTRSEEISVGNCKKKKMYDSKSVLTMSASRLKDYNVCNVNPDDN